jgi:hypothetical protein
MNEIMNQILFFFLRKRERIVAMLPSYLTLLGSLLVSHGGVTGL